MLMKMIQNMHNLIIILSIIKFSVKSDNHTIIPVTLSSMCKNYALKRISVTFYIHVKVRFGLAKIMLVFDNIVSGKHSINMIYH